MAKIILFILLVSSIVFPATAATYYVSASGNDANAGTSKSSAWSTVARVNAATFQPGDRVLFEGGQTFSGGIWLQPASQGTAVLPIVLSSYGVGAATIASGNGFGFYGENNAGIELRRLNFVGSGRSANTSSGVIFYLTTANTHLQHVRLDSLDVSGYRNAGISIGSWNGTSGYTDVRITNCFSHANGEAGISSYSQSLAAHHNWYVGNCKAFDNTGRADITTTHTGNGIVLSGIDGALVEHCEAYNNGALNGNRSGGPVGIWGWCCNNLVIQKCESHHNSSGTAIDGGGFDLDGGCTNSVLQYNYSHDNGGPGYLLAQYSGAPPMTDLTIRYNVSENDARQNGQGAISVWSSGANGGIKRASIHNNTVLLSRPANGTSPLAVRIMSGGISAITLRNNVLKTAAGLLLLATATTTGLKLEGNLYWAEASTVSLNWKGTNYADLASWRAATGQEKMADGRATGLIADPQIQSGAAAYTPLPSSPARGAALNLQSEFSVNPGPRDFVGNPTPLASKTGNIGALETQEPLPVVLTQFTVRAQGPAALLRWGTASEQNNAHFVIESSRDGQTFSKVGQVAGHGSTAQAQSYQFTDQNLARYACSIIYYRLRQVDTDGKTTFSPVVALSGSWAGGSNGGALQVLPNPALAGATVVVKGAGSNRVQLYNVQGQLVANGNVDATGTAELAVAGLGAGIYIVRCGPQSIRLVLAD
ncbi:T9SS type A sorting domain-containing protein [Hymenobacter sp. BT683]|uniref:T9SS type A sorting domain-containing protein n=1 Tax=Hymenobacter jeongseonensis TaxID=2791027 RepID=A0ABS0ILZ6_9BACT|nr:T9SS type A sorting domain-containing protein [Hymenobacter jeongseonensis]MBF9238805.1 T9SS type A sorting domain-containing protein [Hymenobacter jeongseonensis]